MNQRIGKLSGEIERTRSKIADMQTKLRDLERQKTELENAEYIALIRELDMTPAELAAFLKRHTYGAQRQQAQTAKPAQEHTEKEAQSDKE
jgi:peptidoglycan hydrolase CwlO-like protein